MNSLRLTIVICLTATLIPCAAATDHDGDGYDDVWQRTYNVTAATFPPAEDSNGTGMTNLQKSLAGLDPRNPSDVFRIGNITMNGNNMVVRVSTKRGKRYLLQSHGSLDASGWIDEGVPVTGDGSEIELNAPNAGLRRFFRVTVGDQDSDGDGVSDYAEALTGTNPQLTSSPENASGGAASDGDTLRSLLSISLTDISPDAYELEGIPASFRMLRTYGTMPLRVQFEPNNGTSDPTKANANPSDYSVSEFSFLNGEVSHEVQVNAVKDTLTEVPEALKLTLKLPGITALSSDPSTIVTLRDAMASDHNRRLFVAYLNPVPGVSTIASGVATILVSGDNDSAQVNVTFNNLSSEQNTAYLRIGNNLDLQFLPKGQVSGASWPIRAKHYLLTDQAMLDSLVSGQVYLSISSAAHTAGEIQGYFAPGSGSVSEPPAPASPPTHATDEFPNLAAGGVAGNNALDRDIVRFLHQSTFGPTQESVEELRDLIAANGNNALAGYGAWLDKQMDLAQSPSPSLLKLTRAADLEEFVLRGNKPVTYDNDPQFGGGAFKFINATRSWAVDSVWGNNHPFLYNRRREWWTIALNSRDQLRQRMALALSEILVISEVDTIVFTYHHGTANY